MERGAPGPAAVGTCERGAFIPHQRSVRRALGVLGLLAALAGSGAEASGPELVDRVKVSFAVEEMVVGDTARASAVVVSTAGRPLLDRPVRWYSSRPRAATVSHEGLVTGVSLGSAIISAVADGRSASFDVWVLDVPIGRIEIDISEVVLVGVRAERRRTYTSAPG